MSTAAHLVKEDVSPASNLEDVTMVDQKESPSPSEKGASAKTPATLPGAKKRGRPGKAPPAPTPPGRGIAAFLVQPTATCGLFTTGSESVRGGLALWPLMLAVAGSHEQEGED